jgi:transcriptional regulator with XRE-family HTH domain
MVSAQNKQKYIKAFGENLKKIRLSKNLTCEDLEEKTGIDAKSIARLERGERNPSIFTLYTLSKGLDIAPSKLLQFDFKD